MRAKDLKLSHSIDDFERSIKLEVKELDAFGCQLSGYFARNPRDRGRTPDDMLVAFFTHIKSLERLVEQMRSAEEILNHEQADEIEEAYARGEIVGIKSAFLAVASAIYHSTELWMQMRESSGRAAHPNVSQELYRTLMNASLSNYNAPMPIPHPFTIPINDPVQKLRFTGTF